MVAMILQEAEVKRATPDSFFSKCIVGYIKENKFIHHSYWERLVWITSTSCLQCVQPQSSGDLCSSRLSWQAAIDAIRSLFMFDVIARKAILR